MNQYKYTKYVHKLLQLGSGLTCRPNIDDTKIQYIKNKYEFTYERRFTLPDGSVIEFVKDQNGKDILLGKGGFADVYKGIYYKKNPNTSIEIAIKEIRVINPELHAMFCDEIMTMIEYNSLYTVKYYGYTYFSNKYFIFMEFLHGIELYELVALNKLQPIQKEYIARSLIIGLKEMHKNGIAHLDIKLENIMIDIDNTTNTIQSVKYIDFGFACKKDISCNYSNPEKGSKPYLAPEIYNKSWKNPATNKFNEVFQYIDIWALGSTLFVLFTNTFLSQKNSNQDHKSIISSIDDEYIKNMMRKYESVIPERFINVLLNLLKVNPEERKLYLPEELPLQQLLLSPPSAKLTNTPQSISPPSTNMTNIPQSLPHTKTTNIVESNE